MVLPLLQRDRVAGGHGIQELKIRKFGILRDAAGGAGWHVVVKDAEGNWESLSGPHYTELMALIAKKKLIRK